MRFVLSRAMAAGALLTAAALVALVATVLIVIFLLLAWLQPAAAIRVALTEAPAEESTILVTAGAGGDAEDAAARDEAVRALLADGLAGVDLPIASGGRISGHHRLPEANQSATLAFLPELAEHARLVDGSWPEAADREVVGIVVPAEVADHLDVDVGDEVPVHDWVRGDDVVTEIVGIWEPHDPRDTYWDLATPQADAEGVGPLVVDRDDFLDHFGARSTLLWLARPSPEDLAEAEIGEVAAAVERLRARMIRERDRDPTWAPNTRMRVGLAELSGRLELATVVQRSSLVLPAALLAILSAYALALVARLLAGHRQGETALLRARGAGRGQLLSAAAKEGALVVAPAALLSAPLAAWLVATLDSRADESSLGLAGDLATHGVLGPPVAWVVAVAAATGCGLALIVPMVRRGRTWVAEQQQRSRPSRAVMALRAGADVALVALAALAWSQLRRYGSGVLPSDVGGLGIDPVLVAAPVLAVLAVTVAGLRLLPLATWVGVRAAERREDFPLLLGAWQTDRRPYAGTVLLLVLAVATAVLAASVASTWQRSQRDQAAHAVGADLRLEGRPEVVDAATSSVAELPEVAGVMPVARTTVVLADVGRTPLLALDSARADDVVLLRPDLAPGGVAATLGVLGEGRPTPSGIELPPGTQRLRGNLAIDTDGDPELFTASAPVLHVADRQGMVWQVPLVRPGVGGVSGFDVVVPEDATTLVGVRGDVRLPQSPALFALLAERDTAPVQLSWQFGDLQAVDDQDRSRPLEVPSSWSLVLGSASRPGQQRLVPELADRGNVALTVRPGHHPPQQVVFLLAQEEEVPPVAGVFTDAAVQAAGVEGVGSQVDLRGTNVVVAATVASLPGVSRDEAIAVDRAWLSQLRARQLEGQPRAGELWVAASSNQRVAAEARGHGLAVLERTTEADRLLADPLGAGTLLTLWSAAVAAIALAAFGLLIDARATATRRRGELAILHTLGASPATLARAMFFEQGMLAGLGVLAGSGVGLGIAATMAPSLVLTPAGAAPVPEPLMTVSPGPFVVPAVGLLVTAALLGSLLARRARREAAGGVLRIGEG